MTLLKKIIASIQANYDSHLNSFASLSVYVPYAQASFPSLLSYLRLPTTPFSHHIMVLNTLHRLHSPVNTSTENRAIERMIGEVLTHTDPLKALRWLAPHDLRSYITSGIHITHKLKSIPESLFLPHRPVVSIKDHPTPLQDHDKQLVEKYPELEAFLSREQFDKALVLVNSFFEEDSALCKALEPYKIPSPESTLYLNMIDGAIPYPVYNPYNFPTIAQDVDTAIERLSYMLENVGLHLAPFEGYMEKEAADAFLQNLHLPYEKGQQYGFLTHGHIIHTIDLLMILIPHRGDINTQKAFLKDILTIPQDPPRHFFDDFLELTPSLNYPNPPISMPYARTAHHLDQPTMVGALSRLFYIHCLSDGEQQNISVEEFVKWNILTRNKLMPY